jgi:hypothetical protein
MIEIKHCINFAIDKAIDDLSEFRDNILKQIK